MDQSILLAEPTESPHMARADGRTPTRFVQELVLARLPPFRLAGNKREPGAGFHYRQSQGKAAHLSKHYAHSLTVPLETLGELLAQGVDPAKLLDYVAVLQSVGVVCPHCGRDFKFKLSPRAGLLFTFEDGV